LKNIYVGNLAYGTTEEGLRAAFGAYGSVRRVSIIMDRETGKSRGFGFVEMDNDSEGQAAIEALNGSKLDGRQIIVNEARPRQFGDKGGR
jgi:RNA recognition motif-containing protein